MGKIYNQKINHLFQKALDSGEASFKRQEYGFVTKIYMAGIRMELLTDSNGRRDSLINVTGGCTIDSTYIKIWRSYALGYFFGKDFKKNTRDSEGNCPYFIVKATLAGIPIRAIVRELFENSQKIKEQYTDLTKDGHSYTIIKICVDEKSTENSDSEKSSGKYGWLTGTSKVANIMSASKIDEVPGFENENNEESSFDETGNELEAEMMSTYF